MKRIINKYMLKINNSTHFTTLITCSMLLIILAGFSSCDLSGEPTGSLKLVFSDSATSKSLNPEPSLDMNIQTYVVTLTKSDTTLRFTIGSEVSSYTVDALSAGNWNLAISGKNSDGTIVAEIMNGSETVAIRRGESSEISATMVPCSGDGTLSLTVSLTGDAGQLASPTINIRLTDIEGNTADVATSRFPAGPNISFSIPAGWYTASLQLMDGLRLVDTQSFFPRIVEGQTTSYSTNFEITTYAIGDRGPAGGYIFYAFDNTTEIDAIGSHDATISGAVRSSVAGSSGLHFDGLNDYAEILTSLDIIPTVFEVKVYVSSSVPNTTRVGIIAGNYEDGATNANTIGWEIYKYGNPRIYWNNGEIDYKFSYDVRQDKWIYLKFVRDTARFRLYVDDTTADGSTLREITLYTNNSTGSGNGADITLADTGRNLRIGSDYPSTRQPFNGYISDVKIYDDSDELISYYPMKRYLEAAPNDLHLLEDGTVTCDATDDGYNSDTTTTTFIREYYYTNIGELGGDCTDVPLTFSKKLGSGKIATESLVESLDPTENAPRMCSLLEMDGFDDWFIPSLYEMQKIVENLHDHYNPRSTFVVDESYWTSTTSVTTSEGFYTYGQIFSSDYETSLTEEDFANGTLLNVRPARIF